MAVKLPRIENFEPIVEGDPEPTIKDLLKQLRSWIPWSNVAQDTIFPADQLSKSLRDWGFGSQWQVKLTPGDKTFNISLVSPEGWELGEGDRITVPAPASQFVGSELGVAGADVPPSRVAATIEQFEAAVQAGIIDLPFDKIQPERVQTILGTVPRTGSFEDLMRFMEFQTGEVPEIGEVAGILMGDLPTFEDAVRLGPAEEERPLLGGQRVGDIISHYFPKVEDIDVGTATAEEFQVFAEQRELAETRFQEFFDALKVEGRTPQTEALIRAVFPTATDADLDELFTGGFAPEDWLKDNVADPLFVGGVEFIHGLRQTGTVATGLLSGTIAKLTIPFIGEDEAEKAKQAIISEAEGNFTRLNEEHRQWFADRPELTPNPDYALSPFDNTFLFRDPGYYAYIISRSVAYSLAVLGTIFGVTALTGGNVYAGLAAGMGVAGAPESAAMTQELLDQGVPFDEAAKWGTLYGSAVGGIETVSNLPFLSIFLQPVKKALEPFWKMAFKLTANRLGRAALVGGVLPTVEGLEEALTQGVHNAIISNFDDTQSLVEGMDVAFIQGVIAAWPFAAIGGAASYRSFKEALPPKIEAELDRLTASYEEAGASKEDAQVMGTNEIAKTEEGAEAIAEALEVAKVDYDSQVPIIEGQGVYKVGDVFSTPEGQAELEIFADRGPDVPRAWKVSRTDGTVEYMDIAQLDALTDPNTGTWDLIPKDVEVEEVSAEIEVLQETIRDSRLQPLLKVWRRIQRRKDQPADLTLKEYRDLTGKQRPPATSLTKDKKHVLWRDALDSVVSEFGYSTTDALLVDLEKLGDMDVQLQELRRRGTLGAMKWGEFHRNIEESHDAIKKQLTDYILARVPKEVQGKLLNAVRKARTFNDLDIAIKRANVLAEKANQKRLRAKIKSELSKIKPKKVSGVKRGKLTAETQSILDILQINLKFKESQVEASASRDIQKLKIQALLEAYQQGKVNPDTDLAWTREEVGKEIESLQMSHINGMNAIELQDVLDYVKSIKAIGRSERMQKLEQFTEMNDGRVIIAVNTATGGKGLKPGAEAIPASQLEPFQGKIRRLIASLGAKVDNLNQSWGEFLDKLSKFDKTTKQDQSFFSKLGGEITVARNKEFELNEADRNKVVTAFKRIFELKKDGEVNSLINKQSEDEIALGTFRTLGKRKVDAKGEETQVTQPADVELKFTKGQLMYLYAVMKDVSTDAAFDIGMGWTQEMKDAVSNNLTEQEKAWSDWIQHTFLEEKHPEIDAVFSEMFFIHLDKNPNYMMVRRERDADIPDVMNIYEDMSRYGSVLNASLKSRIRNAHPIKFLDINTALYQHLIQMNHFVSHAYFIRDMRAVFGNREVRQAIVQYHGTEILKTIDAYINKMAVGGQDMAQAVQGVDLLRKNFLLGVMGLKLSIPLKQLTALPAYATEMGIGDFFRYGMEFWSNPLENFRMLKEKSAGFRARYTAGSWERDVALWHKGNVGRLFTSKQSFRSSLLFMIEAMDKFGVIIGQYAKYKSGLKAGLSETEAMLDAERVTDRTQNTSYLDTLSPVQGGGSFFKILTMFQNQTAKFYRSLSKNYRNMRAGRISKARALTNMAIIWVLIPAIFQLMTDGFKWRWEKQLRAWILGPLNYMLIVGPFMQTLYDKATGENWDFDVSPALEVFDDMMDIVGDITRLIRDGQDPYKDITTEQVIDLIEGIVKVAGEVTGFPTPMLIQVEKAIRAGEPMEILFSRWALRPLRQNDNQEAEEAAGNLGMSELDIDLASDDYWVRTAAEDKLRKRTQDIENGLSVPELIIYTMSRLDSDFDRFYKRVLPQDVLSDKNSPAIAKNWAEQEIVWQTKVWLLPQQQLYKLFENEADLDAHYKDWQVFITTEFESLAKMEEFIKSRADRNLHYGNLTRKQYELLKGYFNADDKGDYRDEHPELDIDLREEYLKENARDNALLALWGEEKLLTQQAYNILQKMVKTLEIPEDSLVGLGIPPVEIAPDYFEWLELDVTGGSRIGKAFRRAHPEFELWANEAWGWKPVTGTSTGVTTTPTPALPFGFGP